MECDRPVQGGGHVKLVSSAILSAILATTWYVIPVCAMHNKSLSAKTMKVKEGTIAVDASPDFDDRVKSWGGDWKKLGLAIQGKKR